MHGGPGRKLLACFFQLHRGTNPGLAYMSNNCSRRPNGSASPMDCISSSMCTAPQMPMKGASTRTVVRSLTVTLSQTKLFVNCAIAKIPAGSMSKTLVPQTAHHSIYGTTCQARMHGRGDEKRGRFASGPCSSADATAASCDALAAAICRSCSQSSI